jgi:hypothetical protein
LEADQLNPKNTKAIMLTILMIKYPSNIFRMEASEGNYCLVLGNHQIFNY